MLNQLRSLAKSTAIYSLGNVSSKLVGFILLPFFTNVAYLSSQEYGLLGLFEALIQLFITLFGLGIYNGLFRWFYEKKEDTGKLIFTSLFFVSFLSSIGLLIGLLFEDYFSSFLFEDLSFIGAYRFMLITASLQVVTIIPVTLMRLKNDAKFFTITSIIRLLVTLVLTLILLIPLKLKLEGIFIAQIIGHVVFMIVVTPYVWNNIEIKLDWRVPTVMLSYSIPIMLSSLIGILVQFADRFIINSFQGLTEVGIYTLAIKLSNFIKVFVITTFSLSLTPLLFKKINDSDHKRFYSKSMTYYGFVILIAIMFVSLFSYEVIKVFTGSKIYWEAFLVIPVLSISLYFVAIKSVGFMGLHITKKMWFLTVLTVFILGLNIGLNIILIPIYGTMGAAIASFISQSLYFIIGYKISQNQYYIPFEWGKIMVMPILAAILIYTGIFTNSWNLWIRIPSKLFLITLFPILLYFGGFYEPVELDRIKGFYKKWKRPSDLWENLKQILNY